MTVVTGHQPNFLPGVSVMSKVAAADVVIWMDELQYERHGFVNRNRFSDGSWLTIPVSEADTFAPINRVRIADPSGRARTKIARTLRAHLGDEAAAPFMYELGRPYGLLVGLNVALLRRMVHRFRLYSVHYPIIGARLEQHFQSHLAAGRGYDDISEGIAAMVAEVGGTTWLSGPSGRRYLDETPFHERGIDVRYHEHDGPNPTALELLIRPKAAAA